MEIDGSRQMNMEIVHICGSICSSVHALFIAFAPVEKPRIALAVVVENAGSGSRVAAPIARKILDYYFIERLRRASVTQQANDFG